MISTVYKLRNRERQYFQVPTSFVRFGLRHSYSRLFFQTVQSLHIFKVNIPLQILFFLFLTLACSTTAVCQQKIHSRWISTFSPASSPAWHRFSLSSCVSVSYPPPSKLLIQFSCIHSTKLAIQIYAENNMQCSLFFFILLRLQRHGR